MRSVAADRICREFGSPKRDIVKVKAWDIAPNLGAVLQMDGPNREDCACVWLPYPADDQVVPEIALEYPGEAGRHSNTYASPGLSRGLPAMKLTIRTLKELEDTILYIAAMKAAMPLPEVKATASDSERSESSLAVDISQMPAVKEVKARREAIPRAIQREVWQRDGGRCVECSTREKLCFDHMVPFSRGGSNTVRNLQLLCERCNSSKSNRI